MISYTELRDRILFRLGAEGSDHYAERVINAVNGAQDVLMSVVGNALETNKFSAEIFRELSYTAIFQTNWYGEVDLDAESDQDAQVIGTGDILPAHKIWTVTSVHPEFEIIGGTHASITPVLVNPIKSLRRVSTTFLRPTVSASRTVEEALAGNRNDPFAPGNRRFTGALKSYSYRFGSRARTTVTPQNGRVLIYDPHPTGRVAMLAIGYLKVPSKIVLETDQVEWPDAATELLVAMSHRQLSYAQGDQTTLAQLTGEELNMLMQTFR